MPKDRIKDLQKTTPWPRVTYRRLSRQLRNHEVQNVGNDGGIPFTSIEMDKEYNVAEFLVQIDLLRILIDKIEELAKEVDHIHRKMLEPTAEPKLAQEVDDKTADIKKLAYDVSEKLRRMEQVQANQDDADKRSAQGRIKESQIFNMTRRFRDVMNEYNQEFVLHRERCKRVIVRQLEITGNRRTDDELEEALENGFTGTFSFSIMADVEKVKQAANEIEARHRDITKIEESIKELTSMFADLARLVTAQGEMIDNIEHCVSKTLGDIVEARKEINKVEKSREACVKKKIILCIILTAVVVILILIFAAYITTQRQIIGK